MADTTRGPADDRGEFISERIRTELARRRMSRQSLADAAKISLSTLEKAMAGHRPFTLATLIRLEEALGIELRRPGRNETHSPDAGGPALAPEDLGGYSRASVAWLEGPFVTLRPAFSEPAAIFAYRTEIGWSAGDSCLVFQESDRLDSPFTQHGRVSVPNMSGHIYLTTNISGQHRLIIASRPAISGEMYGVLTTLQAGRGASLMPVAASIVLVPETSLETVRYGRLTADDPCWNVYRSYLDRALDEMYVSFFAGIEPPR